MGRRDRERKRERKRGSLRFHFSDLLSSVSVIFLPLLLLALLTFSIFITLSFSIKLIFGSWPRRAWVLTAYLHRIIPPPSSAPLIPFLHLHVGRSCSRGAAISKNPSLQQPKQKPINKRRKRKEKKTKNTQKKNQKGVRKERTKGEREYTRLRERAGEAKKSLVRDAGGFDMSTPMAREALWMSSVVLWRQQWGCCWRNVEERESVG